MNLSLIKATVYLFCLNEGMALVFPSFACAYKTIREHSEHCVMGVANMVEKNGFSAAKVVRYKWKNIFVE